MAFLLNAKHITVKFNSKLLKVEMIKCKKKKFTSKRRRMLVTPTHTQILLAAFCQEMNHGSKTAQPVHRAWPHCEARGSQSTRLGPRRDRFPRVHGVEGVGTRENSEGMIPRAPSEEGQRHRQEHTASSPLTQRLAANRKRSPCWWAERGTWGSERTVGCV